MQIESWERYKTKRLTQQIGDRIFVRTDRLSPLDSPFEMHGTKGEKRFSVIQAFREWLWAVLKSESEFVSLNRWKKNFRISRDFKNPSRSEIVAELDRLDTLRRRNEEVVLLSLFHPQPCHAEVIRNCVDYLSRNRSKIFSGTVATSVDPIIEENLILSGRKIQQKDDENLIQIFLEQFNALRSPFNASNCRDRKNACLAYREWLEKNINKNVGAVDAYGIASKYGLYYGGNNVVHSPEKIRESMASIMKSLQQGKKVILVCSNPDIDSPAQVVKDCVAMLWDLSPGKTVLEASITP